MTYYKKENHIMVVVLRRILYRDLYISACTMITNEN